MRYSVAALVGALVVSLLAIGVGLLLDVDVQTNAGHVEVPAVVGDETDDATAELQSLGIDYRKIGVGGFGTTGGVVDRQTPEPGAEIDPDSATVTLYIFRS